MSKKRLEIVSSADQLFYQQGFEYTSFAHIAETVGISRGNFYYHFKTKDEILDAVIEHRINNTQAMLDKWEVEGETPEERIKSFINILIVNRSKIKRYGCPVGTLTTELSKLDHPSKDHAKQLFTLFKLWLKQQFLKLDMKKQSESLALHVLARSQGIATLASAFQDEKFITKEVNLLNDWLDALISKSH